MARLKRGGGRFLGTVLFTDIVDSTRLASELGDDAWRRLLAQQRELIRRQLRRFEGREVDTAGDGFFAVFDAPARAVGCALAIAELSQELGAHVRAGIHTGEVEEMGRGLGGIAVHIGARIAAAAGAGEVLVSATVRDLAAGAGIEFDDRGVQELKGVPGEWHLYAAHQLPAVAADGARPEAAGGAAREVAAVRRSIRDRARRRRLVIATIVLASIAAVAVTAFVVTRPPPSLPDVGSNMSGVIDAASGRILAEVPVGARPDGIAFGEGAIWVANGTDGTVSRIDPSTRTVVQTIVVGAAPSGLTVGFGSVWVANSDGRTISRINAATNRVVQTIDVGNGPTGIAAGGDAVWVTNTIDGTLSRIDPAGGTVTSTINVGASPVGLAADDTAVWVANLEPGTVSKVDPRSGQVIDSIAVGNGPRGVAIGEGAVWVANSRDATVSRLDPATDRVTATIPVGDGAAAVTVSPDQVWVAAPLDGAIYRVDPTSSAATRLAVGSSPEDIALAVDQLWFTAGPSTASHRGGTLRIVSSGTGNAGFDTFDPGIAYSPSSWSILSMTNDGLVAFERSGGIGGATIVPDLGTGIPRAGDGGLTYTFQLRSGLTYSDGQSITPDDFRRAIERALDIGPTPGETPAANYLGGILGADACMQARPCDLSKGITTDAASGTVTFHLAAPDAEFLFKLALPFSDAVPPSVPDQALVDQPVPATGAYMISTISPTEVRLVRNPRFHEWSPAARPDGYPDEIAWTIGPDPAAQVDLVLGGSADVMVDSPDPTRIDQIRAQDPEQVHLSVLGTVYFFMNTALAPFDDVRVRRAVNLAVDRGRVVELLGESLRDQVTCQFIPPNTPGYAPYCPYSINPNPAGTWTAPDLAAARDLVAASGKAGAKVTVPAFGRFVDASGYVVDLLKSLGFDAALEKLDSPDAFFHEMFDPAKGPLVQAAMLQWSADYPAASSVIYPTFKCGDPANFARFCDAATDALIQSAFDLQQTDPVAAGQRWSAVDRAIVDLAPVAALANDVNVDFVSARVGNYQRHPQWGILLDQLWVQ